MELVAKKLIDINRVILIDITKVNVKSFEEARANP